MRRAAIVPVALCCLFCLPACGYLDDDIGLSDAAYEQTFEGMAIHGSAGSHGHHYGHGHGYVYGCGIRVGTSHIHRHYGLGYRVQGPPVVRHGGAAHGEAGAESGRPDDPGRLAVVEPDRQPAPVASPRLETWGDYLELEIRRAQANSRRGK